MPDVAIKLAPILLAFLIGLALRRGAGLTPRHADRLLRLVVWFGLPPLIIASIAQIRLTIDLLQLPLFAFAVAAVVWPSALFLARRLKLSRREAGVYVTGALMMNLAFEYPFILALFGQEGFAYLALVDVGNGVIILVLANFLAAWYGGEKTKLSEMLSSVLLFPPLLAMLLGVILNVSGVHLPEPLVSGLSEAGRWVVLLVLVAIGIYFEFNAAWLRDMLLAIATRVGLGLACGFIWVELFAVEGVMRQVILLAAAAPIGFNTIVYAERQGLNKSYAAHLVSVSILLGMLYLPVLAFLL